MKAPARPEAPPQFTLGEIAGTVGGVLEGPPDRVVRSVRPITTAGPEDITFLDNPKYLPLAAGSRAGVILISRSVESIQGPPTIRVDEPHVALIQVLELFHPRRRAEFGVSPGAQVGPGTVIGAGTDVHPGACIGSGVRIGESTDIYPGAVIGDGVTIGSCCIIYPNVTIYHGCEIGDRVTIHAGSVIGADGFGYVQRQSQNNPREPIFHFKVPQVGIVVIEDDVEIGANTTIDRAALEETRIGRGTKIDNLVMVAHNCRIGRHAILISQVGISGSTEIGNYVTIAGQAGLVGHITVGDGVTIGAQAGVTRSVPAGKEVFGSPAIDARTARRAYALLERLPEYRRRIEQLEQRLKKIEEGCK